MKKTIDIMGREQLTKHGSEVIFSEVKVRILKRCRTKIEECYSASTNLSAVLTQFPLIQCNTDSIINSCVNAIVQIDRELINLKKEI